MLIELKTENILIIAGSERAGLPNNPFNAFTHLTAARRCEYAHVHAHADTRMLTHMSTKAAQIHAHVNAHACCLSANHPCVIDNSITQPLCQCLLRGICSPACLPVLDIPAALLSLLKKSDLTKKMI